MIAGRSLFTPAVLGSAVFFGLRDPATVTISAQPILAYTGIYVVAFVVVGLIAAAIMVEARKTPHVLWLLLEIFIVFEFGFMPRSACFLPRCWPSWRGSMWPSATSLPRRGLGTTPGVCTAPPSWGHQHRWLDGYLSPADALVQDRVRARRA